MIRDWNDEPKYIYRASLLAIDLETKEPTMKDVSDYGGNAHITINHLTEGTVTYNIKTGEIILRFKKREKTK